MKSYKLKLTALTPVHIGTGEDYEPTNFVIDNGYLYEFDEISFYTKLDNNQKKRFLEAVEARASDSLFDIHRIIKQNRKHAISSAISKVQVSKGIEGDYEAKVGKVVQNEGGRQVQKSRVFNRFQIAKTTRLANFGLVYIPASSIKGAISTAYQEAIYKQDYQLYKRLFEDSKPQDRIFKNLMLSDTQPIKTYAIVGYALNKERFEDDESGPSNKLESIYTGSEFSLDITLRDYQVEKDIDFEYLKESCNKHYLPIFQQLFKPNAIFRGKETEEWTNEYFSDAFYEKYKNFQLKPNQFLLRIGKHSGARAVTIDGMRKIEVKKSGGGQSDRCVTLEQETTTWMFGASERATQNLTPFGWVICEVI